MAFLSGYMDFTKSERKGLVVLSSLIVLFVILNQFSVSDNMFSQPNDPKKAEEISLLLAAADSMERSYERDDDGYKKNRKEYTPYKQRTNYAQRKKYDSNRSRSVKNVEYFEFDPNTLDETGWQALGFSEKQSKAMVNFIKKSKPFNKPEDLMKLFTIDSAKYMELKPYVIFGVNDAELAELNALPVRVSVNNGVEDDFRKIPGLDKFVAGRIVKYRNLLGGFIDPIQLLEVKGMRETLLDSILPYLEMDFEVTRRINVNSADAAIFMKHPYCNDWKTARVIADTRDQFGPYKRLEEILRLPGIEKSWFERIKPYLALNDE